MVRSLDEIEDEYDLHEKLSNQSYEDLKWHIKHGKKKARAIGLAGDMCLTSLGSIIAEQLNDSDSYVREIAISELLAILKLEEYAEQGLKLALYDPDDSVRALAINSFGHVINKLKDKVLKNKIAQLLVDILEKGSWGENIADLVDIECAYRSILIAMNIPFLKQSRSIDDLDVDKDVNKMAVEDFKRKYL